MLKMNKMDKTLASLTRKKTQITNIRYERQVISTYPIYIKKI